MAVFKCGLKGIFVLFRCGVLLLAVNYQCGTDALFMWTAPPPAWNQTNTGTSLADIETVVYPVRNGSTNVLVRWNYTLLPSQTLRQTTFSIGDGISQEDIGFVSSPGPSAPPNNKYRGLYSIYSTSQFSSLTINKVTEEESANFQCKLQVGGDVWAYNIRVQVTVESSILSDSGNQTIDERSRRSVTLFCNASGKPTPNVTWTKDGEVVFFEKRWVIKNVSRNDTGTYRCTAYNGIGEAVSRLLYVNVIYPAKIVTSRHKREVDVAAQQSVSLNCPAEGNPQPTYLWTPCDPKQSVCYESTLIILEVLEDMNYSCTVENTLGSDTANTSLFIASDVINVTLVITSEECTGEEYTELWKKLNETIERIFVVKPGFESVEQKSIRCGNVIVEVALRFNTTVRESEVLTILRNAANNKEFGDITVSSIKGTRNPGIETTMATTPDGSSDSKTWIIVGVVLGVVFALAVAGGVAWYLHKKRKCKKRDPRVHNNGSPGEAGGNVQEQTYDTAQTRTSGAAKEPPALPQYAVVDKSKKEPPALPQYAVVDKSKKKPKKPKPGELQYAELAEFPAGQGGQRSSTSPTNRPTETQYAQVM